MEDASPEMLSIFAGAIERPSPKERAVFLDTACGANVELRRQIEALLRAHDEAGVFLQDCPPTSDFVPTIGGPVTERPGTVIGPYKLLEPIGEGGFGIVFMAEQARPIRRKVALKVLKPGMDTKQVIARFEAERQALALMDHPNIAHVFDGGETPMGRPYFVMELVRGIPISGFCDQNHLSIRQRLELFITVCHAVQHAHLKGIIHRDVKPSNVLVTLDGDKAVVKVIDFGIAKATGQQLTEKTLCTNFAQMIGTPLYMSPEQAQMSGLDIDTRTDVYGLGVLLYELLTGTTPFDRRRLKTAAFDELLRIIREEEPPKPSTRISTLGQGAATVCINRACDPRRLGQLLRGELDWIVMKGLEKDRNRRYESAGALAADVQRYLNDEQVLACPPSMNYRLRKLVRRHKGPVLAALLVILVLVGGSIGTTWGMIRATDAEAKAVSEGSQKEDALRDKEAALADAQDQLFQALVQQARAERSSDRVGQRFEALAAIRRAAKMRVTPELSTEAIAALVLPDVEVVHEWVAWPEGSINLAFDAAYHRYVRMDRQGGMMVCQLRDGQEEVITRLPTQAKPPFGRLWMSPDGRHVAYGESIAGVGRAANVSVWKVEGPAPELLLEVPEGMLESALAFHGKGRQLAVGHPDKSVSIYDLATAKRVQRLTVGWPPVHLSFHPRDGRLAVACGNAVQLFDVDTACELRALRHTGAVSQVYSVAWHPDGRRLATGCLDHKVRLWDTETGTQFACLLEGTIATGYTVNFSHAGDQLASCDWGGTTLVWDVASGRLQLIIPGLCGRFSTDDRIVGSTVSGNSIRLWRLAGARELRVLRSRNADRLDSNSHPVFDTSGRILATCTRQWLSLFDLESGEELASVRQPHADAIRPVFFDHSLPPGSPEPMGGGEEIGGWLTGGHSALFLWPARSDPARPGTLCVGPPRQLAPDASRAGYSEGASASADGRVVAVPQGNSTLVLHRDQADRRIVLGPQYDVRSSAVSPDGHWVVTCSNWWDGRSKSVWIWDVTTGRRVHELPLLEGSTRAKFSPDGRWLMTNSASASQLWEVGTWREVRRFGRGGFTFSPDSRLLAINDVLSGIRLLETTTGREVARLTGPDSVWYQPTCFTPDGTRLVTTSSGYTGLYVWDLRLIRRHLKELGLDWEWPEFPPPDSSGKRAKPLKVEVQLGDLGKPTLTRAQKARQAIEHYRPLVAAKPDNALACNNLAWVYATAPEQLRDVKAAVPLAEKAVQLAPKNPMYVNTLGVVYYRVGRYREAVELLRANLASQEDWGLAFDLYFLAMSHQRLGAAARARDYYDWAVRWTRTQQSLSAEHLEELTGLRAEAKELLEIKENP
jgi:serine/threonine protein kinase/WD40 repeat protein